MSEIMETECKHCGGPCEIRPNGPHLERVCQACGKHNGFAKKKPEDKRSATLRGNIKPNQRSRIIQRAKTRCECCGRPASATGVGLHVGHVVSIDAGVKAGVSLEVLNSDENLIAECEECNLGHGRAPLPMAVFIAILMTRQASEI
jgi:5-methylcytosine-specific restriction endonuclease McrA